MKKDKLILQDKESAKYVAGFSKESLTLVDEPNLAKDFSRHIFKGFLKLYLGRLWKKNLRYVKLAEMQTFTKRSKTLADFDNMKIG